ncbi:2OG-Fe(II) oxygenase family protein [Aliiglaciecola sp. CAU 1673]|uniref:2OG-Fe(II) oxygenase n=1 Tax=Aliiglaciecola sp. CAU 1673 TaxID=3032595 RepID=UPI0023D9B7CD|nr:2OG-Fe(II) oxygenase family protein [Aliiglaciecola sp. CAU 1673]MDF2179947.1 2OG-Fe(II) oxygenase family protein [Aliiglaciecola sp. CAU 1673]
MHFHPEFDPAQATIGLTSQGRCQLKPLLDQPSLTLLQKEIAEIVSWNLVTRLGGKHLDLDSSAMDKLPQLQQAEFYARVMQEAEQGFQYLFETFPIYDAWHQGRLPSEAPVLAKIFEFINSESFLSVMREMLKCQDIGFADAQLTRYRPGHFLTWHDDEVKGKNRVAAFVLSLSQDWQAEWGGLLQFDDGGTKTAFLPQYNCLSIFKVPTRHQVTPVISGAGHYRYSITGWLRSGEDPGQ